MGGAVTRKESMEEEAKKLYEMKLFETFQIPSIGAWITRVPGGWIYENIFESGVSGVFISFHNEFMDRDE